MPSCRPHRRSPPAFTLLELLVVIGLIAVLATLALPAIKAIGTSNAMAAANRQLADDLGLARLKAINERTTVYVVFIPAFFPAEISLLLNTTPAADLDALTNCINGQLTSYALFTERRVGEQPGQKFPRYLTEWRSLPEGIFIPTNKFTADYTNPNAPHPVVHAFAFTNLFPFPVETNLQRNLPFIAFDSQGRLVSGRDEIIPLTRGSLFFNPDQTLDVVQTPPNEFMVNFNHLRINWLTGRVKVERPEIY
jgi:prepilin-type N-terminal cleavage/methylation domain-containing protein